MNDVRLITEIPRPKDGYPNNVVRIGTHLHSINMLDQRQKPGMFVQTSLEWQSPS